MPGSRFCRRALGLGQRRADPCHDGDPRAKRTPFREAREPGVIAGMANGWNGLESHGGRASGLAKARVSSRSCQEAKIAYVVIDARLLKNRRRVASFSRAERQRLSAMSQTVWKAKARRFKVTSMEARCCSP